MNTQLIFDFTSSSDIQRWKIVNDGVMGGKSAGRISLNSDGHAAFSGQISLENYGGFSSVQYSFDKLQANYKSEIKIRVKGDGKNYQLRVKDISNNYYSYITTFSTSGKWEDINITLGEMYPSFRGRKLDLPNFNKKQIEEVVFLIANKKAEKFELLIDKIELIQ
ncbi:MAG: CIA30 family protein [Bacteroidia bacterium]|nr:CIA30 family protein [Bacteroidia bacterium]NNJ55595.1 CIA30 family protein [Bacteroidia bacterium]